MEPLPIPEPPELSAAERVKQLEAELANAREEYNAAREQCRELRRALIASGTMATVHSQQRHGLLCQIKADVEAAAAAAKRTTAQRDQLALDLIRLHAVASELFWMVQSGADVRREAVVLRETGEVVELLRQLQSAGKLPRA